MTFSVFIVFPVGIIMFFIIRHQVMQGKSIMRGNKVNAGSGAAIIFFIKIRAAGDPRSKFRERAVGSPPVITDAVAVFAVPLRPAGRELTYLVAAFPHIPGFCNQLYL